MHFDAVKILLNRLENKYETLGKSLLSCTKNWKSYIKTNTLLQKKIMPKKLFYL